MDSYHDIDAIIARVLSKEATLREKEILAEWLSLDKSNADQFEQISDYWQKEDPCKRRHNFEAALVKTKTFIAKDTRKKRYRKKTLISSGAVAIFSLMIVCGLWLADNKVDLSSKYITENILDLDKSYIILPNGRAIEIKEREIPREFYTRNKAVTTLHDEINYFKLIVARKCVNSIVLPDDSHVTVSSSSWLTFPDNFPTNERRVKLSGEAVFDVVEDKSRPFTIELQKSEVVVLGTSLNIKSYEGDVSVITLMSGSVEILSPGISGQFLLSPGEQAIISKDGITKSDVDVSLVKGWMEGYFYFDRTPLAEIVHDLTQWYGVPISLGNGVSHSVKISGTIERSENIEMVFNTIQKSHPLLFDRNEEGYVVRMRD